MSDTMHSAAEGLWEIQNADAEQNGYMAIQQARAEEILKQFGQFVAEAAAAPEPEEVGLEGLYASLGLATTVCVENSWSVAGIAQMDVAYEALRRAQERLEGLLEAAEVAAA